MKVEDGVDARRAGVYFIEGAGLIKIGVAGNIKQRFSELKCGSPVPLRLVSFLEGASDVTERWLHLRFAGARRHGEWFEPTEELSDLVYGRSPLLAETCTPGQAAQMLDVGGEFARHQLAEELGWPAGYRGGSRIYVADLKDLAELVEVERIRRLTKRVIRQTMKQLSGIAERQVDVLIAPSSETPGVSAGGSDELSGSAGDWRT